MGVGTNRNGHRSVTTTTVPNQYSLSSQQQQQQSPMEEGTSQTHIYAIRWPMKTKITIQPEEKAPIREESYPTASTRFPSPDKNGNDDDGNWSHHTSIEVEDITTEPQFGRTHNHDDDSCACYSSSGSDDEEEEDSDGSCDCSDCSDDEDEDDSSQTTNEEENDTLTQLQNDPLMMHLLQQNTLVMKEMALQQQQQQQQNRRNTMNQHNGVTTAATTLQSHPVTKKSSKSTVGAVTPPPTSKPAVTFSIFQRWMVQNRHPATTNQDRIASSPTRVSSSAPFCNNNTTPTAATVVPVSTAAASTEPSIDHQQRAPQVVTRKNGCGRPGNNSNNPSTILPVSSRIVAFVDDATTVVSTRNVPSTTTPTALSAITAAATPANTSPTSSTDHLFHPTTMALPPKRKGTIFFYYVSVFE